MENLRTKVTFIKNKFHIRLLENDLVINEMACKLKIDTSWCCKYMLRWYDKLGGSSKMATKSRHKSRTITYPTGKIWHEEDLRGIING